MNYFKRLEKHLASIDESLAIIAKRELPSKEIETELGETNIEANSLEAIYEQEQLELQEDIAKRIDELPENEIFEVEDLMTENEIDKIF